MVKNKVDLKNIIDKFIESLKDHITVSKVILFGSWVNGDNHQFSDIDLAIFSPDFGKHKLQELQLLSKLAWQIDESIEAIPYSIKQLENPEPVNFVYEIIQSGEIVYEGTSN